MTLPDFANVFALLAVQLRLTDADEATIRVYFEALRDLEFEFVQMAAQRLAATAEWFPKTSEWRRMAAKIEAERNEQQRAVLRQLRTPLCAVCRDTGWAPAADNRVARCACATERRLEVLGRRPLPSVPSGAVIDVPPVAPEQARAELSRVETHTGKPAVAAIKTMPKVHVEHSEVDHD